MAKAKLKAGFTPCPNKACQSDSHKIGSKALAECALIASPKKKQNKKEGKGDSKKSKADASVVVVDTGARKLVGSTSPIPPRPDASKIPFDPVIYLPASLGGPSKSPHLEKAWEMANELYGSENGLDDDIQIDWDDPNDLKEYTRRGISDSQACIYASCGYDPESALALYDATGIENPVSAIYFDLATVPTKEEGGKTDSAGRLTRWANLVRYHTGKTQPSIEGSGETTELSDRAIADLISYMKFVEESPSQGAAKSVPKYLEKFFRVDETGNWIDRANNRELKKWELPPDETVPKGPGLIESDAADHAAETVKKELKDSLSASVE